MNEDAKILVTFDTQTGNINMQSSVTNKAVALGMLEVAKDLILHPPQAASPIVRVSGVLPN